MGLYDRFRGVLAAARAEATDRHAGAVRIEASEPSPRQRRQERLAAIPVTVVLASWVLSTNSIVALVAMAFAAIVVFPVLNLDRVEPPE